MRVAAETEAARDHDWSTGPEQALHPLRSWAEAISLGITEMDVASPMAPNFRARWRRYGLGPIDLNFLEAAAQRVTRSDAIVARTRTADYELIHVRRGPAAFAHGGSDQPVAAGDFFLLDNRQPYTLSFSRESECLTAHLADGWLRRFLPQPEAAVGRPIAGSTGWGAALAAMLSAMADHGLDDAALPRGVIADQFGSLLALTAGRPRYLTSRHSGELLTRLKRELQARCSEPELDPETIASVAGISKRHLHGLFARAGTTFGAALLEYRLSRAAAMLTDPRLRAYRMGEIAWACGFADPSHFARRFKRRYGSNPMRFRDAGGV